MQSLEVRPILNTTAGWDDENFYLVGSEAGLNSNVLAWE